MKNENNELIECSEEYVSISEAIKRVKYLKNDIDYGYIYNLAKISGRIGYYKGLISLPELTTYLMAHQHIRKDIVWDDITPLEGETIYFITGYDYRYGITNKYRIINFTLGTVFENEPRNDGYIQIQLMKNGKETNEYLHRITCFVFNPILSDMENLTTYERLRLPGIDAHHIKIGKRWKACFYKECLIATNQNIKYQYNGKEYGEHDYLHKLWDDNNTEEYWKMIKEIKKRNGRKLYKIPHPDYESNGKLAYFYWVDIKGKKAFDAGKDIPLESIYCESAEFI